MNMEETTPRISLCMILRDEETHLPRCLASAQPYIDEIIAVDTGSQDATPQIAEGYGAKVISAPWQEDFSQARNESLRHATGDWILILDADEELPPETGAALSDLTRSPQEGWFLIIASPVTAAGEGPLHRSPNLRFFRNRPQYRFTGRIHEQILPSLREESGEAAVAYSDLTIHHYGYIRDKGEGQAKTLRNIHLLNQALADTPEDGFVHYNLAVSLFTLSRLSEATAHYQLALANTPSSAGFLPLLYRNYALCLQEQGAYPQALRILEDGLAHFPDYPDLHFLQGQIYFDLKLPEAAESFQRALSIRKPPSRYTTTEGINGWMAADYLTRIGQPSDPQQNWEDRLEALEEALARQQGRQALAHALDAVKQLLAQALTIDPSALVLRRELIQLGGAARILQRERGANAHD